MKYSITTLLFAAFIFFFSLASSGQRRLIRGVVLDSASRQPLSGATIRGKGATTLSGADGAFALTTTGKTLVCSMVGYKDQDVLLTDTGGMVQVFLAGDVKSLSNLVITGYTQQSKVKTVGSLTTISGATLQDVPVASFDVMLQGRVPGLYVGTPTGQPGEAGRVTLRGMGSINGNVQPLYLVDGVQVANTIFSGLNTEDFESVVVLKDAASTAQYGSRGANGVIVITTRKGKGWEDGKVRVDYNTYYGISQVNSSHVNPMNTNQRLQFEEIIQDPTLPGWAYSPNNPIKIVNGGSYAKTASDYAYGTYVLDSLHKINTNWAKVLLRTAVTQSDQVNISGNNGGTNYYLSLGYLNQQGIALNSGIERYSLRGNIQNTSGILKSTLNIGVVQANIRYIQDEGTAPTGGASAGGGGIAANNPIADTYFALPYQKPDANATGPNEFGNDALNEYANADLTDNQLEGIASLNEVLRLTHSLQLTSTLGMSYQQDRITDYLAPNSYFGQQVATGNAGMYQDSITMRYHLVENIGARYFKHWGSANEIEVNLLGEANRNYGTYNGYTGYGLNAQLGSSAAAITQGSSTNNYIPLVAGSTLVNNLLLSQIALLRYSYGSKYTFTASLRRDGSSQVPTTNRYINLYALGAKWNILEEPFMRGIRSAVSALRIRGSYGLTANAGGFTTDFGYQILYAPTNYGGSTAVIPQSPGNPNYNWEISHVGDMGIEFGFLDNRLYGEVDGYDRTTSNLFVNQNLSLTTGWPTVAANLGKVRNVGTEIELNADLVRRRDLKVTLGLNFAYNKNTLLTLGAGEQEQFADQVSMNRVGYPLGTFYAVRWGGVNPQTGAPIYLDINGKPTSTYNPANAVPLKSTWDPPYKGGVTLGVTYKRFDVSVLFSFIRGMSRFSYPYWYSHAADPNYRIYNQSADMLAVWQKAGQVTPFQGASYYTQLTSQYVISSDYIKLRNVSLSYSVPLSPEASRYVRGLRVFVNGQNLYSWMKWKGYDPEDANDIAQYEYPMPRTVTAGLNVSL
ncbi:SusC/RagA family TonB-linked outer membrane protein [Dinghuibacter silviterrae]|uniref:TonB-linked SusC/RagA family outer membrane protein n=1 Tax=Dinghuibacter silviterrae TaxID=1539049 RepID=A0A4R8DSE8_9BACT|nr:SusC/RagA family TonB-linked outer membrane protein [Dinghuibacter silviterrae]TDX00969.1 TonB-linked SusC/RagA family outer membrane protein [Dinghuibacter silviterrae]